MSKSRGDCGIYDQRPGRQTDPQNMPTYLCPVGFSQSWMCTYVHKHIQGLLEPTRNEGSVFYKHLILKCLWNRCSGAAMGKNCRKRKRGPFLNWIAFPWLQSISESWFFGVFLASLLGMLLMAGMAIQVCSGFQAKDSVPPSLRSHSREREKDWQQLGAPDLSNDETPSLPASCSVQVHVLWIERLGGWGCRGGRILCRWRRERKQEPTFPPWAQPTL